jgi:hypothetical protein
MAFSMGALVLRVPRDVAQLITKEEVPIILWLLIRGGRRTRANEFCESPGAQSH